MSTLEILNSALIVLMVVDVIAATFVYSKHKKEAVKWQTRYDELSLRYGDCVMQLSDNGCAYRDKIRELEAQLESYKAKEIQ